MNDHEALVLKIPQNSPLSKVWRLSPTSYAEREITCPHSLNATVCPYCTYSTSHDHSYVPLTWFTLAVPTSWSSTPPADRLCPIWPLLFLEAIPAESAPLLFPPASLGPGPAWRSGARCQVWLMWRHIIHNMATDSAIWVQLMVGFGTRRLNPIRTLRY